MRTLKFRAWDKQTNAMWFSDKEPLRCDFVFGRQIYLTNGRSYAPYNVENIMQYTGLHDRNGKEIYEEDIVVMETVSSYPEEPFRKDVWEGAVIWDAAGFGIQTEICKGKGTEISLLEQSQYVDIEVIGNIYENPELIK